MKFLSETERHGSNAACSMDLYSNFILWMLMEMFWCGSYLLFVMFDSVLRIVMDRDIPSGTCGSLLITTCFSSLRQIQVSLPRQNIPNTKTRENLYMGWWSCHSPKLQTLPWSYSRIGSNWVLDSTAFWAMILTFYYTVILHCRGLLPRILEFT